MLTNISLIILNLWFGLSASARFGPRLSRPHSKFDSTESGYLTDAARWTGSFSFRFSVVTNLPKL